MVYTLFQNPVGNNALVGSTIVGWASPKHLYEIEPETFELMQRVISIINTAIAASNI